MNSPRTARLRSAAAALTACLDGIGGPIVLVGHSYGGAVIGNVHDPDVKANVFVAAFAPAEGEIVQLLLNPFTYPGSPLLPPAVLITPVPDANSPVGIGIDGFIPELFFHQVFAQDLTPAVAADLYAHQTTAAFASQPRTQRPTVLGAHAQLVPRLDPRPGDPTGTATHDGRSRRTRPHR